MFELRKYDHGDGKTILGWIKNELAFKMWSADRFNHYPISEADFDNYLSQPKMTIDCQRFVMTYDDKISGHIGMEFNFSESEVLFFLVIVDSNVRAKGLGKNMLNLAMQYALEKGIKNASIWVFEENLLAYRCYKSLGFKETGKSRIINIFGKDKKYLQLQKPLTIR